MSYIGARHCVFGCGHILSPNWPGFVTLFMPSPHQ